MKNDAYLQSASGDLFEKSMTRSQFFSINFNSILPCIHVKRMCIIIHVNNFEMRELSISFGNRNQKRISQEKQIQGNKLNSREYLFHIVSFIFCV